MPPKAALALVLQEIASRTEKQALDTLYPDEGPLRRELYVKHVNMLNAGAEHDERVCFGGNRVGKTLGIGAYETALHATGLYPTWWEGHRFDRPILIWTAGTKAVKVRDVNQKQLFGKITKADGLSRASGGLIPAARIDRITRRSGVTDAIDQAVIRHARGWENLITLKSYEEGRTSFEAEEVDFIWLDEEPSNKGIYDECKTRLITSNGKMLTTFTPLQGMSETVLALVKDTDILK